MICKLLRAFLVERGYRADLSFSGDTVIVYPSDDVIIHLSSPDGASVRAVRRETYGSGGNRGCRTTRDEDYEVADPNLLDQVLEFVRDHPRGAR